MAAPMQGCGQNVSARFAQSGFRSGETSVDVPCEIQLSCGKQTFGVGGAKGPGSKGVQGWCSMVTLVDPEEPYEITRSDIIDCQNRLTELHNQDSNITAARWELLSSTMLDMDPRFLDAECNECLYPHYGFDDDEIEVAGLEIDTENSSGNSNLGSCCIRMGDRGWPGNPDEPLERIWSSPLGGLSGLQTNTTLELEDSGAEQDNPSSHEWHTGWFRSNGDNYDTDFDGNWSNSPRFRWEIQGEGAWGPQLVGWVCGFNSPAYQTAKAIYDTATQSWTKTINYCFDSFTCPALWKEPTEQNLTDAGLWGHEECIEPTLWGIGGIVEGLTLSEVEPNLSDEEDSPLGSVCHGAFVNAKNIWDISPATHERVPMPGLQAPINCEQCSLGYINAPDDGTDQTIGLGHKDQFDPSGSQIWTPGAAMTARNLRGTPHSSSCMTPQVPRNNHWIYTDIDGNISANPHVSEAHYPGIEELHGSNDDQGYFPCRCTPRNLTHYTNTSFNDHFLEDPNNDNHAHHVEHLESWQHQYHSVVNPFSWQEGDYVSDPRLPGVCALKHNFIPSLGVILQPDSLNSSGNPVNLDQTALDWKQRFDWKRRSIDLAHGDHYHTTSYLRNYASEDEFVELNNPTQGSNAIGSCCYVDGEKHRAENGISQSDCENNKRGIWSKKSSAEQRVKNKEPLCCKTCSNYAVTDYEKQQISKSQSRTFRSMVHNNSIIATSPTIRDIEENHSLLQELISICENCDHSNEYNLNACSRVSQIIKIYEDEKDISCYNSRKEDLEDDLKEYYRCKCTLLDEIVSNLIQVYRLNVCIKDVNPNSVEETTLMSSINELLSNYKSLEDNCYEIIKDHDDMISTNEKQKGCCCQYIKPGNTEFKNRSNGTKIYNGGDLRKCGNMKKFECAKIQAYDTVWSRCIDDCSDSCRDKDKPEDCKLCNGKINNSNVPYSQTVLNEIQEELQEESGTPIRSCCFGRTPTIDEVPRGTRPERYTIYDCAYGFTKKECQNSKWLDDDTIKSTRWREDDCGKCTCCKDGETNCLQSGGCNPVNRSSEPDSFVPESSNIRSLGSSSSTETPSTTPRQTGGTSTQSSTPQTGRSSGGYGY